MNNIKVENIISFQSVDEFERLTGADYYDLSDQELFEILEQWHYPGEHETNFYSEDDINTVFLGHIYNEKYLISRYENGLTIGLGYIVERKGGEK